MCAMALHHLIKIAVASCLSFSSYTMGANILVICPITSASHFNVIKGVYQNLAVNGHNITLLSALKDDSEQPIRHIQIDVLPLGEMNDDDGNQVDVIKVLTEGVAFSKTMFLWSAMMKLTEATLESKSVQEFIKNDNSNFDLIICEEFNYTPYYMLAYKYKAPLVTYVTYGIGHYVNNYMGNPMNLHYIPHEFIDHTDTFNFCKRIESMILTFVYQLVRSIYYMPKYNQIAQKHFGHLPQPLPDLMEIEKNISLVLINTHYTIDHVRSLLPNIVEVGGIHVKDPKPLPQDLQQILDNAKHGVIYFSMGSNLDSKHYPKEKVEIFLRVLSKLKQQVLWKWDDDTLTGIPNNVIVRKWFPQSDLLAHPNVRLFITHGGRLSTIETMFRGVPIIGIPMYGDQSNNLLKAKKMGVAEMIAYSTLSYSNLQTAVDKLLNDPSYLDRAKHLSRLINDRPMSPMDTAMYWMEYVIRHKGAYHVKPPLSSMHWSQYYLLDVVTVLIGIAAFSILILTFLLRNIYKKIRSIFNLVQTRFVSSNKKNS